MLYLKDIHSTQQITQLIHSLSF